MCKHFSWNIYADIIFLPSLKVLFFKKYFYKIKLIIFYNFDYLNASPNLDVVKYTTQLHYIQVEYKSILKIFTGYTFLQHFIILFKWEIANLVKIYITFNIFLPGSPYYFQILKDALCKIDVHLYIIILDLKLSLVNAHFYFHIVINIFYPQ